MPQILKKLRDPLMKREVVVKEKGDLCYLITAEVIIPQWVQNPRWNTASELYLLLVHKPDMVLLRSLSRGSGLTEDEIKVQAALAYTEFYRRCVANYENSKAKINTDVYKDVPYARSTELLKGE